VAHLRPVAGKTGVATFESFASNVRRVFARSWREPTRFCFFERSTSKKKETGAVR
jgi:hypothetical protein